jgi:glucose/arabinose dehydrogenase/PKD repeat protein
MKSLPTRVAWLALAVLLVVVALRAWPTGVIEQTVAGNWSQPVGLCFAEDGRMFVWEKAGLVWNVENGVKAAQPLIDIREEVGDWRDHGMLGFAIDEDFLVNGYVYLLYVVDYHHLKYFGTPQYLPTADTYYRDTIGRLTRYTCTAASGFHAVDPASRTILIGESFSTGFPIHHQSHSAGSIVFGEDHTLLVSFGDGASYEIVDTGGNINGSTNTALGDGIIRPEEDVGAFRSQMVGSLNGKVLRVDAATGDGVPSNPFYDPLAPRAARSRVWALGLRNPFRMTLLPGSGKHDPALADPGTLFIGDVGWNDWEELDVCDAPAQNFGWPFYEGLQAQPGYISVNVANLDEPNPLFGVGACTTQYFAFGDLLVQDTLSAPSWPNPCDSGTQVPASTPRFEHVRPILDWHHGSGPARTKIYSGNHAAVVDIGAANSPVAGQQFGGNTALACTWFPSASLGPQFQDTLLFGDYTSNWLKSLSVDALAQPLEVRNLAAPGDTSAIVAAAYDPVSDRLHVLEYGSTGFAKVQKIVFAGNLPPEVVASATPEYGRSPLAVQFTASGSTDPEGQPLSFAWNFGDGVTSTQADPAHVFESLDDVTQIGAITAKVLTLNPPHPTGGGNWDPEVIRDGDWPPVGNGEDGRQFDTFHGGAQGADDWIGYAFAAPREFRALAFQEGKHFSNGGWFSALTVQVRSASVWTGVQNLAISPVYPAANNGVSYETYKLTFTPAIGDAIRLFGDPGGPLDFVSVGELRAFATPLVPGAPARRDVTLRVSDAASNTISKSLVVSLDNTPPQVQITSPIDGAKYPLGQNTLVALTAIVNDAEHLPAQLSCTWQTILHHDIHTHPEPPVAQCSSSALISPLGCDGHAYFYEFRLTVSDPAGLSTTQSVSMYPDCCGVAPVTYCTAKLNSQGCLPAISSTGTPRASQSSGFVVRASNVRNNRLGILIYSLDGPSAAQAWGGYLCVTIPLRRTPPINSGGNPSPADDCSGVYSVDLMSFAHGLLGGSPAAELLVPGTVIDAQWWGRDPGFAPPGSVTLSAGLEFVVCD